MTTKILPYNGPIPPVTADDRIWHDMACSEARRATLPRSDFTYRRDDDQVLLFSNNDAARTHLETQQWPGTYRHGLALVLNPVLAPSFYDRLREHGFTVEPATAEEPADPPAASSSATG
jgi:hypothetical protein